MDDRDRTMRVIDQARAHRTQMTPRSVPVPRQPVTMRSASLDRSTRAPTEVAEGISQWICARAELAAFLSDLEGIVEHLAPSFALCVHPCGEQ